MEPNDSSLQHGWDKIRNGHHAKVVLASTVERTKARLGMTAATHGIVFEVGDEDKLKELNRYTQADASMHTLASWEKRMRLRRTPAVRHSLHIWWMVTLHTISQEKAIDSHFHGLDVDAYIAIYKLLFQALAEMHGEEYDEAEAIEFAEADFAQDSSDGKSVKREVFQDSLFELADLWTDTVDSRVYAQFLLGLLKLSVVKGTGPDSTSASAEEWSTAILWRKLPSMDCSDNEQGLGVHVVKKNPSAKGSKNVLQAFDRDDWEGGEGGGGGLQPFDRDDWEGGEGGGGGGTRFERENKRAVQAWRRRIVRVQALVRAMAGSQSFKRTKMATITLQASARRQLANQHLSTLRAATLLMKTHLTGLLGRRQRLAQFVEEPPDSHASPPTGAPRTQLPPGFNSWLEKPQTEKPLPDGFETWVRERGGNVTLIDDHDKSTKHVQTGLLASASAPQLMRTREPSKLIQRSSPGRSSPGQRIQGSPPNHISPPLRRNNRLDPLPVSSPNYHLVASPEGTKSVDMSGLATSSRAPDIPLSPSFKVFQGVSNSSSNALGGNASPLPGALLQHLPPQSPDNLTAAPREGLRHLGATYMPRPREEKLDEFEPLSRVGQNRTGVRSQRPLQRRPVPAPSLRSPVHVPSQRSPVLASRSSVPIHRSLQSLPRELGKGRGLPSCLSWNDSQMSWKTTKKHIERNPATELSMTPIYRGAMCEPRPREGKLDLEPLTRNGQYRTGVRYRRPLPTSPVPVPSASHQSPAHVLIPCQHPYSFHIRMSMESLPNGVDEEVQRDKQVSTKRRIVLKSTTEVGMTPAMLLTQVRDMLGEP